MVEVIDCLVSEMRVGSENSVINEYIMLFGTPIWFRSLQDGWLWEYVDYVRMYFIYRDMIDYIYRMSKIILTIDGGTCVVILGRNWHYRSIKHKSINLVVPLLYEKDKVKRIKLNKSNSNKFK